MNKQQTFDKVCRAVLRQGEPSRSDYRCMYRGPRGLKCAVGHLIEDDEYKKSWDRASPAGVHQLEDLRSLMESKGHDIDLLRSLQIAHDTVYFGRFLGVFHDTAFRIAIRFGLKTTVLDAEYNKARAKESDDG